MSAPEGTTHDRILHADREPQNWLTYGGSYSSQRYSLLDQITRENVGQLALKWVWRPKYLDKMETTPLVVDGVMYAVQNSEVVAIDAATGRTLLDLPLPRAAGVERVPDGRERTRDLPEDRVFWATYDGHLIAIDAKTGKAIWNKTLVDYKNGPAVQRRAARRQGQGHPRAGDERVRRQLLGRGVRRPHRQRGLALQDRCRSPASPATRRGRATRGSTAARRSG